MAHFTEILSREHTLDERIPLVFNLFAEFLDSEAFEVGLTYGDWTCIQTDNGNSGVRSGMTSEAFKYIATTEILLLAPGVISITMLLGNDLRTVFIHDRTQEAEQTAKVFSASYNRELSDTTRTDKQENSSTLFSETFMFQLMLMNFNEDLIALFSGEPVSTMAEAYEAYEKEDAKKRVKNSKKSTKKKK